MDNINVTNKNNTMLKNITLKIDEDNDICEMRIQDLNGIRTYTLDPFDDYYVYDSEYSELFDELNLLIDKY